MGLFLTLLGLAVVISAAKIELPLGRGQSNLSLSHVVNFDVPVVPDDYVHRVGRTARAEMTGAAFTLVAPEEESSLRGIERAINQRLPRVTLPDFDYTARPAPRPASPPHRPHGGRPHNRNAHGRPSGGRQRERDRGRRRWS